MSEEILTFEIVIDAKLSEGSKEAIEELKATQESETDVSSPNVTSDVTDKEKSIADEEAAERLEEFLKTTDSAGMKNLSSFAKNPTAMVEGQLMKALGKAGIYGLVAAAIISLVLAAPDLIKLIVEQLSVKGGPLNQDFHLFLDEQGQLGIDREIQYRYATGLDVIITNYDRGYLLTDPGFVSNNLVDIDTTRSVRLTNNDVAYGYVRSM